MSVDSVREVREVDQVSTAVLPYRSKLFAVYVLSRTRLKDSPCTPDSRARLNLTSLGDCTNVLMQYKTMRESPQGYARGKRLSRLDLDDSTSSPSANEFALFPLSKALPGGRPHIGLSMQLGPYKYMRMAVCDK